MQEITEISRFLGIKGTEGIESFTGTDSLAERIRDWFETPQGTVADRPEWGQRLGSYKFAVVDNDFLTGMEMDIVNYLPVDVDDVVIDGITIEETAIDSVTVTILFSGSSYDFEVGTT